MSLVSILPFSNEISNVLTSSGIAIFSGLYQHDPKGLPATVSKTLIDFIALSGIVMASVQTSQKSGSTTAIVQGVLVLLVAFVIPNLTFHSLTQKICGKCNAGKKLIFGFALIGILFAVERYVVHGISHSFAESHDEETIEE